MKKTDPLSDLNRREFLKGGSLATLLSWMGGVRVRAQVPAGKTASADQPATPPLKCGVIGVGNWGRELVAQLTRLKEAEVAAICDPYGPWLRRASRSAPSALPVEDYRAILDNQEIPAVLVATPSHLHRQIVIDALQAGKHVYCEAPLAASVEDARAIALAAKAAVKQVFQAGLQIRSDPQRHFLLPFIRAGAMGRTVQARAQWNKKQSWRHASPNAERERELNWRLNRTTSPGLIGEIGIHQVDAIGWFLNAMPVAVTGFGSLIFWKDGRDVPDTIQALFEYPGGVNLIYHSTLCNSFDSDYEMLYGTDAAVMIRENKAWMFKEVDSPLLGWEVYARKDVFYRETGIALVANATKLAAQGDQPAEGTPFENPTVYYALEAFVANVKEVQAAVEDFTATFATADLNALSAHLASVPRMPAAGYQEGFEATVLALKANEAILNPQRLALQKEWFAL